MISDEDVDGPRRRGSWRRGRELFDAYDVDRVLSEQLADDLVNELVGLRALATTPRPGPRRRVARAAQGVRVAQEARGVRAAAVAVPPHLTVLSGGDGDCRPAGPR